MCGREASAIVYFIIELLKFNVCRRGGGVSVYTKHALRLCRMKNAANCMTPPWKNIIITGTSGGLSFHMQISRGSAWRRWCEQVSLLNYYENRLGVTGVGR